MPKLLIPFIFFVTVIVFTIYLQQNTITTMKFFPFDENVTIDTARTNITMNDNINWEVYSSSSDPAYLRQDVSLLYENGLFKGMLNKWRQDVSELNQQLSFTRTDNAKLEAISFHHAEIHQNDENITSAQKMSNDSLYVVKDEEVYRAFKDPDNAKDKQSKDKMDQMIKHSLQNFWNKFIQAYHIQKEDYYFIPLTDLYRYESENFPNFNREETDEILGKLWEGIYKNYIVLLHDEQYRTSAHYIPLILLAKDKSHLYVIFELNDEREKLIQQIPPS